MMYQLRLIDCNKYITPVWDAASEGGYALCGDSGRVPSVQFYYESKTALKNKLFEKGQNASTCYTMNKLCYAK